MKTCYQATGYKDLYVVFLAPASLLSIPQMTPHSIDLNTLVTCYDSDERETNKPQMAPVWRPEPSVPYVLVFLSPAEPFPSFLHQSSSWMSHTRYKRFSHHLREHIQALAWHLPLPEPWFFPLPSHRDLSLLRTTVTTGTPTMWHIVCGWAACLPFLNNSVLIFLWGTFLHPVHCGGTIN